MSSVLFGAFAKRTGFTDQFAHSYSGAPASPYACADGSNIIGVNALYGALSGKGATRTATMYAGGAAVGITVGSGATAADTGWFNTNLYVVGAGTTLEYGYSSMSGQCYFGRGADGTGAAYNPAGQTWTGNIGMYIGYIYTPNAPTFSVSPALDGKSADVTASPPSDNGGSAITGYTIQVATDSAFTSIVQTVSSTGTSTITGLTPGQRYYWRVTAKQAVTTGGGKLGGTWSSTMAVDQPVGSHFGKILTASGWADASAKILTATGWADASAVIVNGSLAWVSV